MTHSQESLVSSAHDNLRVTEESRSGVSSLASQKSSHALEVDHKNEDSPEMKDLKSPGPFPWLAEFCRLCQTAVGSRNVRHLESLMNVYIENIKPNVIDCYKKPNRAAKLKKNMNNTLIFFYQFYMEIKETLEHSFYLEKMTSLVSMFMDLEIKASSLGKENLKKVASRLTSSLYIFLDNSEEHILDAILMTKLVNKNYYNIWHPLFEKILDSIRPNRMNDLMYVRCLLTFKLWKKITPCGKERIQINTNAVEKLKIPPHLMENMKKMGNVLPRIPKTKKNITLFLMQSNFNLKNSCQEFLMSKKKPRKSAHNQEVGVEIDKPLFFVNHSGNSSPRLTEKENGCDSWGNILGDDIWPSISTTESNTPQNKRLIDLFPEQPTVIDSQETLKKKRAEKKKGKKQKVVKSAGNKKKNRSNGFCDKFDKKVQKLSNLNKCMLSSDDHSQTKAEQVTLPQVEDGNQLKVKTSLTEIEEYTQVIAQANSTVFGKHSQIRNIKTDQLRADSFLDEEFQKALLTQPFSNQKEKVISETSVRNEESELLFGSIEPPVKKLKLEYTTNTFLDSSFKNEDSVASDAIINDTDIIDLSVGKTASFVKCNALSNESILTYNGKCEPSEEVECVFDSSQLELFRVERSKDQFGVKALYSSATSITSINEEVKPSYLGQKSKTVENSTLEPLYSAKELCDSSLNEDICDIIETAGSVALDDLKTEQIELNSDIELVAEFNPREAVKCITFSEEECINGHNRVSLTQELSPDLILLGMHSKQEDLMSRGVHTVDNLESDSDCLVIDSDSDSAKHDFEPVPANDLHCYSKSVKGDDPYLLKISTLETDNWLNEEKSLELERLALLSTPMKDYEASKKDSPKTLGSSTRKTGMVKIFNDDSEYNFQKEPCAFNSGKHNSQVNQMVKSSESDERETSPRITSDSSPQSKNAKDTVEYFPECSNASDNAMKTSKLNFSCEPVSGYPGVRFYTLKPPEVVSHEDVNHNAQISYTSKSSDHHLDDAHVLVKTMSPHSAPNQVLSDRLSATSSRPETSSRRNNIEASSLHSPLNRQNTSTLPSGQTVESHSSPGKHKTRETGNNAVESRAQLRGTLPVPVGVELEGYYESPQYESSTTVTPTVPSTQYVQGSFFSASQASNIPTSAYPSTVGHYAGNTMPPISAYLPCKCSHCSVGSIDFSSSTLTNSNCYQGEKNREQDEKSYNLGDVNYSASDTNYNSNEKTYSPSGKNYCVTKENSSKDELTERIYDENNSHFNTINSSSSGDSKSCVEAEKSCMTGNDRSLNEKEVCANEKDHSMSDQNCNLGDNTFEEVSGTNEAANEWKSQNEKLLQKIEQLCAPKYDFNSNSSLPLKKRLKISKMCYGPKPDSSVIDSQSKTKLESFPSYPATPMISIADITTNDFFEKWESLYLKNGANKSITVDNQACNPPGNLQNPFLSNQNAPHTTSSANYGDTLVQSFKRNLLEHCVQCAKDAFSRTCDSTFQNGYYDCKSSSCSSTPSSSLNLETNSCTNDSIPLTFKTEDSAQNTQDLQYYQIPGGSYFESQLNSQSNNKKQKLNKWDGKSVDGADVNESHSIGRSFEDRREEALDPHSSIKITGDTSGCSEKCVTQNSRLKHHEVEKQVQPKHEDEEEDEEEEYEEEEDEEDGDGEEDEGEIGDDNEEVDRDEVPEYIIVQKASCNGSSTDSKNETNGIMPFRIFLNKSKYHKEFLAKNSCAHCKMVDCKGNCFKPSSGNATDLSNPSNDPETNADSLAGGRIPRKRGRKSKSNGVDNETVRKSERIHSKKCSLGCSDFLIGYDVKQKKKNAPR